MGESVRIDEIVMAERDRLRAENKQLRDQLAEIGRVDVARGLDALQASGNRRTDDTGFAPGARL